MQFTPSQAAEHLKESIASYIESQYRFRTHCYSLSGQRSLGNAGLLRKTPSSRRLLLLPRPSYCVT